MTYAIFVNVNYWLIIIYALTVSRFSKRFYCKIKLTCNSFFYFLLLFFHHLCNRIQHNDWKSTLLPSTDVTGQTHIGMEQLHEIYRTEYRSSAVQGVVYTCQTCVDGRVHSDNWSSYRVFPWISGGSLSWYSQGCT